MPTVKNTTGVPVIYGDIPVGCNGTIEVDDSEAIRLVSAGWQIVAAEVEVAPLEIKNVEEPPAPEPLETNEKEES